MPSEIWWDGFVNGVMMTMLMAGLCLVGYLFGMRLGDQKRKEEISGETK